MGGSVAVTVRHADGKVDSMLRWTNVQPNFVKSMNFIDGDPTYIEQYMEHWRAMKRDWDANHGTGKFEFLMTDAYLPYQLLAPDDYGLIVYDFATKTIASMQGYCSFDHVHAPRVADLAPQPKRDTASGISISITTLPQTDIDEDRETIAALHAAGRLQLRYKRHQKKKNTITLVPAPPSFDDFVKLVASETKKQFGEGSNFYLDIALDIKPWTVHDFAETSSGAVAMRQALVDNGFILTPDDEAQWASWIADRKENE